MNGARIRIVKSAHLNVEIVAGVLAGKAVALGPQTARSAMLWIKMCSCAARAPSPSTPSPSRTGTSGIHGLLCGIIELERERNEDEVFDIQLRRVK